MGCTSEPEVCGGCGMAGWEVPWADYACAYAVHSNPVQCQQLWEVSFHHIRRKSTFRSLFGRLIRISIGMGRWVFLKLRGSC